MLVIGPSGSGKTRDALKPNLLQMTSSYLVLDTKGTLCREVAPCSRSRGMRFKASTSRISAGWAPRCPTGSTRWGTIPCARSA